MEDSGVRVRRRKCEECGYTWCTAQEPEYLLPRHRWNWQRAGGMSKPRLLPDDYLEQTGLMIENQAH